MYNLKFVTDRNLEIINLGNLTVKNLQYKQVQQSPLDAISFGFTATLFVILYVL